MRCEQCQEMMVEALYAELDDALRARFDEHVAACRECATAMASMRGTLDVMNRRERRDPGRAYWDSYWDRLSARMDAQGVARGSGRAEWWRRSLPGNAWAYRAAAAAAILVVGVFVGRTFFPAPAQLTETAPVEPPAREEALGRFDGDDMARAAGEMGGVTDEGRGVVDEEVARVVPGGEEPALDEPAPREWDSAPMETRAASADDRAMRYVAKSQLLLIALVNNDPSEPDAYAANIGEQRDRSRQLVAEAAAIKDELDDPKQRRLRELVGELEKILVQIANLESDQDMEGVEFIRSRVNDHDVLFKIDLEQMRHGADGGASEEARESKAKRSL